MKTQQRKFVVERKSGRRRVTIPPKSIWGDTDLKALVLAAETDAPNLFDRSAASDTPSHVSEPQTEPEVQQNHDTKASDQPPIESFPAAAEQNSPQGDDLTFGAAKPSKLNAPRSRRPKKAKRLREASDSRQAESANIDFIELPTDNGETTDEELFLLEVENRRLKALLSEHFRQQNMQLQTMLARFGLS
jgi:hypothetical protein